MQITRKYLSVILFLLGWLSAQAVTLDHEFSQEHIAASCSFQCIAQTAQLDDFTENHAHNEIISFDLWSERLETPIYDFNSRDDHSLQAPRAPPVLNS